MNTLDMGEKYDLYYVIFDFEVELAVIKKFHYLKYWFKKIDILVLIP